MRARNFVGHLVVALAGVLLGLLFASAFALTGPRWFVGSLWLGYTLVWCAGMVRANRR